jgi:hypothetical protein
MKINKYNIYTNKSSITYHTFFLPKFEELRITYNEDEDI